MTNHYWLERETVTGFIAWEPLLEGCGERASACTTSRARFGSLYENAPRDRSRNHAVVFEPTKASTKVTLRRQFPNCVTWCSAVTNGIPPRQDHAARAEIAACPLIER